MYKYRQYNLAFHHCLNLPIRVALFERSISVPYLCTLLELKGFKYNVYGVNSFLMNTNISNLNFNYVSNIYEALNLPLPTPQYLYDSFKRWEEIKAFKLERRNTNRIKKGLLPVTSISTRIK
jgi:hypothetical protein